MSGVSLRVEICAESTAGQIVVLAQSWSNKEEADCGAKGLKLRNPGEIGLAQAHCCLQLGLQAQTDLVKVVQRGLFGQEEQADVGWIQMVMMLWKGEGREKHVSKYGSFTLDCSRNARQQPVVQPWGEGAWV